MTAATLALDDRLAGAVWGVLVGDALGVPYEFTPAPAPGAITFRGEGTWHKPAGTWSDDGALTLALLDSLLEHGFDPADQARRYLAWADEGAYTPDHEGRFDIGGTTARALDRLRHGIEPTDAGPTEEQANGNGSLMRILPLALVERDLSDAELVGHAHLASRVTHGHATAQVTCALYVLTARGLLGGAEPAAALADARETLSGIYAVDPALEGQRAALPRIEEYPRRGGTTYVIDAFWSAWDAFAERDSYRAAVTAAVAYGNDTDTTAAICGGLAGIRWGRAGIPAEWLAAMRGQGVARPIVERLVATAV